MVAVFINLDDSDPGNGGLAVFPGSHKLGPLKNASDSSTHFYVDQVRGITYLSGSNAKLIIKLSICS